MSADSYDWYKEIRFTNKKQRKEVERIIKRAIKKYKNSEDYYDHADYLYYEIDDNHVVFKNPVENRNISFPIMLPEILQEIVRSKHFDADYTTMLDFFGGEAVPDFKFAFITKDSIEEITSYGFRMQMCEALSKRIGKKHPVGI